jgi:hypothetical protein
VFLLPLVLIRHLFDFLEEGIPLLELSAIIAEKEVKHVEGELLLFRREKERGITNRRFWCHPISPKCIIQCIVPVLVIFRNCPLNDLDQIFVC